MSGFVTDCTPSVVPPAVPTPEQPVEFDGWFPPVDPQALRKRVRIRDGVTPERLREAIVAAMISVGNQLEAWQAAHVASGHAALAAVPSKSIDGESRLVALYRRAIDASVKAELVERYRDVDLTGAGQRQVDELDQSVGELRRDALHAIRDMLGRTRLAVELL